MDERLEKKDYVSMWFKVRKEIGISDAMNIAKLTIPTKDYQWKSVSHSEMDGLGGIAKTLRQDGYRCQKLPVSSEKKKPNFWEFLKILLHVPPQKSVEPIKWKYNFNVSAAKQGNIHCDFFSEEHTRIIRQHAKKNKVTLNHYILWALNKSISENLLKKNQHYLWLYPVNLRGPLDFGTDYFNYSSMININVTNNMDAMDIHRNVKKQLKAKMHWVNWYMANIGKIVGMAGVRFLYRRISQQKKFAGSFSFLGQWPLKDEKNPDNNLDEIYVTCGIGTPNYPVSTGVLIWFDRLSLGIKLHPTICDDDALTQKCLKDWMSNLIKG